jgi:hypothetical protein
MKKNVWAAVLVVLLGVTLSHAGSGRTDATRQPEKKATITKLDPTRVPAGRTYALLDDDGRVIQKFKAGTRTSMTIDCVQIDCPGTFSKSVVCWRCEPRIKAK